jgi:autotransporter-associated beta strand protein
MKKRTALISLNHYHPVFRRCLGVPLITLSALALTMRAPAQNAGDFRSITSSNWNSVSTWERYDGANWVGGFFPTNANAGVITIQSGHSVTNTANVSADQVIVAAGGTLVAQSGNFTAAAGADTDLDIFGTFIALSGGSALTIASGANVIVESGGVFIHNGTSGACVNNSAGASALQFTAGGKFQLQRPGGTIPTATWSVGSTCEIAYATASTSRPGTAGLAQTFEHFTWNNPLQSGGVDLGGALTNINGNFLVISTAGNELKWNGDANFGGNVTVQDGVFNVSGSSTPRLWTLKGNLTIQSGATFHLSAGAGSTYTLVVNGTGIQNYTCDGLNTATKLNWTVNSGSTLNLNSDLPLSTGGRTLTASGTVNLNGKTVSTDLIAGNGTIRNQGGGNGMLALGAGNGNNTLDGTLALLNGTSGTLGLVKLGTGTLTITAPQTFGGGLIVSNGIVMVENTSGSGTGPGAITAYGGTLGGHGIISGAVSIQSGATLSPGASAGNLTINNTLTLGGNTLIEVDKGGGTNDQIVATVVNYGGTLTVSDLSGGLNAGDSFTIVSAGSHTGDFSGIVGSPGPNLAWQFNPATGVLSVIPVAVNPPTLFYSVSGNSLNLSWVETGFKLQSKTNSLNGVWSDYSGGASSPVPVPIDSANGSVFFRLAPQ